MYKGLGGIYNPLKVLVIGIAPFFQSHHLNNHIMKNIKREYHGMSKTKIYKVWADMKQRCYNKTASSYKYYGGRGITVCELWIFNFLAYYNFVRKLKNYEVEGYSLDRIENEKGYEPGNVKYSTKSEQTYNRRTWGKSKYKGVSWDRDHGKWRAQIYIKGKTKHIGLLTHELEAHQAVQTALKKLTEKAAA